VKNPGSRCAPRPGEEGNNSNDHLPPNRSAPFRQHARPPTKRAPNKIFRSDLAPALDFDGGSWIVGPSGACLTLVDIRGGAD
jgi:hypothetical protein